MVPERNGFKGGEAGVASEEIRFDELFDLQDLQDIQDKFAAATGVASIITRPDGAPITRPSNFCRLCIDIIRKTGKGLANCYKSDAAIGGHHPEGPIVQPCLSGGLWDAGASITVGGKHVANWLIGQVRNEAQDEQRMREYAVSIDADPAEFMKALQEVPVMSKERFEQVAQMLFTFANQLSLVAYQNLRQSKTIGQRTEELEAANAKLRDEVEEHRRLEGDIRQILDAAGDPMCVIDCEKRYIYVNRRFEELAGVGRGELLSKNVDDILVEEERQGPADIFKRIMAGEERVEADFWRSNRQGVKVPCIFTATPFHKADGKVAGMVCYYKDITERIAIQEVEKVNAIQKGRIEMSNNILHDVGNAVTAVGTTMVRLLSEKEWEECLSLDNLKTLFERRRDDIARALGEAKADQLVTFLSAMRESLSRRRSELRTSFDRISHCISHINSILNVQRQYAHENLASKGKVDMPKVVEDALMMQASSFEKRGVKIRREIDSSVPMAIGDHTRLMQVLLNVMRNSCEAFDDFEVEDKLFVVSLTQLDERTLRLRLSDNGVGFAPALAERLFERGFSTKKRDSGLGLHECRDVIEAHRGAIRMESDGPGKGATTYIELPIADMKEGG